MSHGILIIEDEAVLARNIKTYLERAGYDARTAPSAEEGLRQIEFFPADLVILDYRLPGMDGIQLSAKLRRACPDLRLLMLTAHHSPVLEGNARRVGAAACLQKPIALDELRRIVDGLLLADAVPALRENRRGCA